MVSISAVNPAYLDEHWPYLGPYIESAMQISAYGGPQDVYEAVKNKLAVLWVVWEGPETYAVAVTQLHALSKSKSCGIWICEGREHERWYEQLVARIEEYARVEGCTLMRHEAREGWRRKLKLLGYRCTHVILEKAL